MRQRKAAEPLRVTPFHAIAQADAELIGVRRLEIVVDQVDLATQIRIRFDQSRQQPWIIQISRIPGDAVADADIALMTRHVEATCVSREGAFRTLDRKVVEDIAIVGASRAAEQNVTLVAREVVREAHARLDAAVECFAIVAGADVVVDVDPAERECLSVGLAQRRIGSGVDAVDRVDDGHRRHIVQIARRSLIVIADTEIELQLVSDVPVVLQIDAKLFVVRLHVALGHAGHHCAERDLIRRHQITADVVVELRVVGLLFERVDLDLLVLDARLHDMRAHPFEWLEGQIVLERIALLAFVLIVGAAAQIQQQPVRIVGGQLVAGLDVHGPRIELRVLEGEVRIVQKAQARVLIAQVDARFGVVLGAGVRGGILVADAGQLAFIAILHRQLEQMIFRRCPVDFAEHQIFIERSAARPEELLESIIGDRAFTVADRARRLPILGLIRNEEMHLVADDRSAE